MQEWDEVRKSLWEHRGRGAGGTKRAVSRKGYEGDLLNVNGSKECVCLPEPCAWPLQSVPSMGE